MPNGLSVVDKISIGQFMLIFLYFQPTINGFLMAFH